MGIKITIDADVEKKLDKFKKQAIQNLQDTIDGCRPAVTEKVLDLVDEKLHSFVDIAVSNFYSWEGKIYTKRRNSLKNKDFFITERDGTFLKYWFDSDLIRYRNEKLGLYDTIFVQGYHGGAYFMDGFYYRKPVPYYTYWGRPAEQASVSPLDDFTQMKEDYEQNGFRLDFKNIWVNELKNHGINLY